VATSSNELKLAVEPRTALGTTGAQRLRAVGKIPAVLYGHGDAPEHVAVDGRTFEDLLHHGGRSGIITLTEAGKNRETVLVREIQLNPVSRHIVHIDFQRVSANETIHTTLPVVTVGTAEGVRNLGGVMDVITHELEVSGPANRIPEHLEVDVTALGIHEHVTAGDVKLPTGFTMVTPAETIVVSIESSRTERELEEAATGPAEAEEPEVIGSQPAPASE
jgi:large subunit ribosomal protein L25